jgi:hypothetical protein
VIDPSTGKIKFSANEIMISGQLTREQFLSSTLAAQSQVIVRNEPYCSFNLPKVNFEEHSFAWSLWFHNSILQSVSIACCDSKFGTSWSDWSEDKQKACKQFHDDLLVSIFGENFGSGRFLWGSVQSTYDVRAGSSSIKVIYSSNSD